MRIEVGVLFQTALEGYDLRLAKGKESKGTLQAQSSCIQDGSPFDEKDFASCVFILSQQIKRDFPISQYRTLYLWPGKADKIGTFCLGPVCWHVTTDLFDATLHGIMEVGTE